LILGEKVKRIFHVLKIKDEVELIINKDKLIIKGVKKRARQGWNEAFAKRLKIKRINYYFLKILPYNHNNSSTQPLPHHNLFIFP
jgi:uncharacterized protein with von Willebrand factor type A (vWA) domain